MEQQLYKNLNELLKDKYTEQYMRDEAIATMGDIVINESMIEIIESIADEQVRGDFISAINVEDMELAESIARSCHIDTSAILKRRAVEMLAEQ